MDKNVQKTGTCPSWVDKFATALMKGIKKTAAENDIEDKDDNIVEEDNENEVRDKREENNENNPSPTPGVNPSPMGNEAPGNVGMDFRSNMDMEPEQEEFKSEINIDDLESIIWQDNEYKVLFNDNNSSAKIINSFGNIVTELSEVRTLNDVNDKLNAQEIVINIASDESKEIKKEANYQDEIAEIMKTMLAEDESVDEGDEVIIEAEVNKDNKEMDIEKMIEDKIKPLLDKIEKLEKEIKELKSAKVEEEKEIIVENKLDTKDDEEEIEIEDTIDEDFDEADDLDLESDEAEEIEDNIEESKETVEDVTEDFREETEVVNDEFDIHPEKVDMSGEKFDYSNILEIIGRERELFMNNDECPECMSDHSFEIEEDTEDGIIATCKCCNTKYAISKADGKIYKKKK